MKIKMKKRPTGLIRNSLTIKNHSKLLIISQSVKKRITGYGTT